jgi:two-component system chemotaxis response regulator CheY
MRRLLIVEDSASTRALVRTIVEDEAFAQELGGGFEVTEAASGFDAMRLLPRGPYDVIITDINMGDINGLELIKFVRNSDRHRTTPLIIISTQSTERDIERALSLGADAFLPKPFSPESLRKAISAQLTHARG